MSDFEERLSHALGDGAEQAPTGHGLADSARRRLRARRQRFAVVGGAVAVMAVVVPVAVLGGAGGSSPGTGPDITPADELAGVEVTCGGDATWPVPAMSGGIAETIDEAAVRDEFARLKAEAGIDAPKAIQDQGAAAASYIVLSVDDATGEVTLGLGPWSTDGPGADAQVLYLEPAGDGYRAAGWGGCGNLAVALPEGRSRVEVFAPEGGVDPTTTSLAVLVNEVQCTSGRDPLPYLGEPEVVATGDRVLVTLDSDAMADSAFCIGNPSVPITLHLDEPLGDRQLFDAGTWPPTPIEVASANGWRSLEVEGVHFKAPYEWVPMSCPTSQGVYGPDAERCGRGEYLALYGRALFDPAMEPNEIEEGEENGETLWAGYVFAGDWAVFVRTHERQLTEDILATVRP